MDSKEFTHGVHYVLARIGRGYQVMWHKSFLKHPDGSGVPASHIPGPHIPVEEEQPAVDTLGEEKNAQEGDFCENAGNPISEEEARNATESDEVANFPVLATLVRAVHGPESDPQIAEHVVVKRRCGNFRFAELTDGRIVRTGKLWQRVKPRAQFALQKGELVLEV